MSNEQRPMGPICTAARGPILNRQRYDPVTGKWVEYTQVVMRPVYSTEWRAISQGRVIPYRILEQEKMQTNHE